MSNINTTNCNAILVSRLSIERCQAHLAHLHALMHLCRPVDMGCDQLVAESFTRVMEDIEGELGHSVKALNHFE